MDMPLEPLGANSSCSGVGVRGGSGMGALDAIMVNRVFMYLTE
jgi:hypothetical protein